MLQHLQVDEGGLPLSSSAEAHYLPHDGTTLTLPATEGAVSFSITSLSGRQVASGTWTAAVDISSLPRGVYRLLAQHRRSTSFLVGEFKK